MLKFIVEKSKSNKINNYADLNQLHNIVIAPNDWPVRQDTGRIYLKVK